MITKTITYEDYNGNKRTEEHCFHLTKADVAKMELSVKGGMAEMIKRIVNAQDGPEIMKVFEELITKSYGVKTADGRGFDKDPKHLQEFMQTEAYSQLFMELIEDAEKAAAFFTGILPKDLQEEAKKALPAAMEQLNK